MEDADSEYDYMARMTAMVYLDAALRWQRGKEVVCRGFPTTWEQQRKGAVGAIIRDLREGRPLARQDGKLIAAVLELLELYNYFSKPKDRKEAIRFFAASDTEGTIKDLTEFYKAIGVRIPIAGHGSIAAPRAKAEGRVAADLKIDVGSVKRKITRAKLEQRKRVRKP